MSKFTSFPTCQVRVARFYQSYFLLLPSSFLVLLRNSELQISVGSAGLQPDARENVKQNASKNVRIITRKNVR